jgi:hypothetical protein
MKEKFTGPASGKPESDSGVFKIKKPVIEPLDWGDFGDINGEKKPANNPFKGYSAEADVTERKLTPQEEEQIWRSVYWKYPRTRAYREFKQPPKGPNGEVIDPKEEAPIYTEEEKRKILPLFEKQKQLYFERKKLRSK